MGTNYYHKLNDGTTRHIGKSSGGWCFSLRVYPEHGLNTLRDWAKVLSAAGVPQPVVDSEGRLWTAAELVDQIVNRSWSGGPPPQDMLDSDPDVILGPNGLVRNRIDGVRCVGHGAGTWDYIATDFR